MLRYTIVIITVMVCYKYKLKRVFCVIGNADTLEIGVIIIPLQTKYVGKLQSPGLPVHLSVCPHT